MKYEGTMIVVKDIERSKRFYQEVLGLEVVKDFGANVTLTGGVILQTLNTWKGFIQKQDSQILFENNAAELYFEEDEMDAFLEKLQQIPHIEYVNPVIEYSWGQRVVRFYDPDKHIIEVGENMTLFVRNLFGVGLSVDEIAAKMDVPVDFVRSCL